MKIDRPLPVSHFVFALLSLFLLCAGGCNRTPPTPAGPVFDVPSLLGKTMKEIEKTLGPPAESTQQSKIWRRESYALTVKYSPSSDLVTELAFDAEGEARKDTSRDSFLKMAKLTREGDDRYQVAFIEAPDKVFYFTGVRIDVPQSHKVQFIVEGPEVLVSVTYATMSGGSGGGNGDNILTLPPWKTETTANIGQQLVLDVAVMTKPGKMPPPEKLRLQIIVDGRVLKEVSAVGSGKCEVQL